MGETMKRLFVATLTLCAFFIASSAHASMWNWSFDTTEGTVAGTLTTMQPGYGAGIYDIIELQVTDNASTMMLLGNYNKVTSSQFTWNDPGIGAISGKWLNNLSLIEFFSTDNIFWEAKNIPGETPGNNLQITPVPIPAAAWLFMSGLLGLVWKGRKVRQSVV
jgi:hypothetical protein